MLGSYHLQIKFGDSVAAITTSNLLELTIIQDIDKFLPEFRLRVEDTTGILTHISPFDSNMSKVTVELGSSTSLGDRNSFDFSIYSRQPEGDQSSPSGIYDIKGLLDIPGLFTPSHSRGFSGSIRENLKSLAINTFLVDQTSISKSLDYSKNLLQPGWTNAQFLNYLKKHLIGTEEEHSFKCTISTKNFKKLFQFRSLTNLLTSPITYKFILSDQEYEDRLPVFNYFIYDNYKVYGAFGIKQQAYSYFDYDKSVFTTKTEQVQDYISLSDYFLIDGNDPSGSNLVENTGRTNEFEGDFKGRVKGDYGIRINNLVKMWITSRGIPNIIPGEVVEIFFPHGASGDDLYSFQYSGYWLVERVIHMCGDMYFTKLLLTRPGLDTDKDTTLVKAKIRRKV